MAIVKMDTVEGTELEVVGQQSQAYVRTGLITQIEVEGCPDEEVMFKALEALQAAGHAVPNSVYNVEHPELIFQRCRILAITKDQVRVALQYSTFQGTNPSAYIIRRSSGITQITSHYLPGTREKLTVAYVDPLDATKNVPEDVVPMGFGMPTRVISVTVLNTGDPPDATGEFTGYVNDATWQGLPAGYWRTEGTEAEDSKYSGYWSRQLTAATKNLESWSTFGTLRNTITGKYIDIDPDLITALMSIPYSYGTHIANGIIRADPYPETDFEALFGFA